MEMVETHHLTIPTLILRCYIARYNFGSPKGITLEIPLELVCILSWPF